MGYVSNLDFTGKVFTRLTALRKVKMPLSNKSFWECRCECGTVKTIAQSYLVTGNTKSCGCLQREAAAKSGHSRAKPETALNVKFANYKKAAGERGFCFDLTKTEFAQLLAQNCVYCGCSPSAIMKQRYPVYKFMSNGVDRVDNTVGYTVENSVSCCKPCNFAKQKMSRYDFIALCQRVTAHQARTVTV